MSGLAGMLQNSKKRLVRVDRHDSADGDDTGLPDAPGKPTRTTSVGPYVENDDHREERERLWNAILDIVQRKDLEVAENCITKGNKLGHGRYSDVYQATIELEGHNRGSKPVAMKEFRYARSLEFPPVGIVREMHNEVRAQSALAHPNIVALHGVQLHPRPAILLELMSECSLNDLMVDLPRWGAVSMYNRLKILTDVTRGLAAMHELGFIHRDIKSHNVMLSWDTHEKGWHAKLGDFGSTLLLAPGETLTGALGTLGYTAPEVQAEEAYDHKADIFSYGVLVWECLRLPEHPNVLTNVSQPNYVEAVRGGLRPHIGPEIPADLADLVQACWHSNPVYRPNMKQNYRTMQQARQIRHLDEVMALHHQSGSQTETMVHDATPAGAPEDGQGNGEVKSSAEG